MIDDLLKRTMRFENRRRFRSLKHWYQRKPILALLAADHTSVFSKTHDTPTPIAEPTATEATRPIGGDSTAEEPVATIITPQT
jgi:hypothetical protein